MPHDIHANKPKPPTEHKLNELVDLSEEDKKYLNGWHNWLQRMYFYLNSGLNILNQFRNLGFLVAALWVALKLDGIHGILIAAAVVVISSLLLVFVGRYNVHHLSRSGEWLSIRFSTIFGIRTFNNTERQTELMEEILKELRKQNNAIEFMMHGKPLPEISIAQLESIMKEPAIDHSICACHDPSCMRKHL